ncbi:MAG: branched-chain amino acid transporter permease [Candidatus Adiutrix sp.]
MTPTNALFTVLIIALATLITRALPFLLFPPGKTTPKYLTYLGRSLPCATIALLIIYCIKTITPLTWPHGLPEFLAIITTAAVQYFTKTILISIAAGTLLYMALIQNIF